MIPTADLLRLAQWLSPAFPVSGYAYSHGLETAMAAGRVTSGADVRAWAACVLRHGSGALDAWAIRATMAGADPSGVADVLRARAGSPERWAETRDQGAAFAATTEALGEPPIGAAPLPVALGLRARGMAPGLVLPLYLQGFATQLVMAAARFLPLGQTDAQAVLRDLQADVEAAAARDDPRPPGGAALLAEMDALAHETLAPRLFRT